MENISFISEIMLRSEALLCVAYLFFACYTLRSSVAEWGLDRARYYLKMVVIISFFSIAMLFMFRSLLIVGTYGFKLLGKDQLMGLVFQIVLPALLYIPLETVASGIRRGRYLIILLPVVSLMANISIYVLPEGCLSCNIISMTMFVVTILLVFTAGYTLIKGVRGDMSRYSFVMKSGVGAFIFCLAVILTLTIFSMLLFTTIKGESLLFFIITLNVLNIPIAGEAICPGRKLKDDNNEIKVLPLFDEADNNHELRERLLKYFNSEKPFLKPDLTINEVARELYSNKTYISRVINDSFNLNFNQFVNKFRVEEATRLYMKDTSLNLSRLCSDSGFGSIATFTISFRLFAGLSPAEWCKDYKKRVKRDEDE